MYMYMPPLHTVSINNMMHFSVRAPHDMAVATRQMGDSEDSILQGLLVYFSKFNYDKAKEQAVSKIFNTQVNFQFKKKLRFLLYV